MRKSTVTTHSDSSGEYEQEVFDCDTPKRIILGIHGNGVRRWDGEKFFYQVAEHFTDSAVALVDQNQVEGDGCKLNNLETMSDRNQKTLAQVMKIYPNVPVWVVAHSMGCGVTSLMDTSDVNGIIFVSPGVGKQVENYIERYGKEIVNGKVVKTSDGLTKNISKEFMESAADIYWQAEFLKLLKLFPAVHVFESGADEIVDEERFELRDMPFASYTIVEGAPHNFFGEYSRELFEKIKLII